MYFSLSNKPQRRYLRYKKLNSYNYVGMQNFRNA